MSSSSAPGPPRETFEGMARSIQASILERVGVPVSIGIGRSRTLAKPLSDTVKPFGVGGLLDADAEREYLRGIPVTEFAGIAGRREKTLRPWGIATCLDLAAADRRLVRNLLTAAGEALWWELNGDPVQAIHADRPRHQLLARGGSFGEATDRPLTIYAWLVRNLDRLIEELEYHRFLASRLEDTLAWAARLAEACRCAQEVREIMFDA